MGKNKIGHILVIRLSALGDVAMIVPVLKAFTEQHPDVQISVLTRPFFKPLFNGLNGVEIIEADLKKEHKGVLGLWKLSRELSRKDLNAFADLHNVLRTKILRIFFGLNKAPFIQIDKGRKEKKELTSSEGKILVPLKSTHERYADVFRKLGFELDLDQTKPMPKIPISGGLGPNIPSHDRKWVGIAPFAAFEGKMYPLNLMEEFITALDATDGCDILLFGGGQQETELLDKLADNYRNTTNVSGKYSFTDELTLISNLDAMVSMDSGNGHLAAVYGIPTITLWGTTHPYAGFYPFAQDPDNALLSDRGQYPLIPTSVYGNKLPPGYEKAIETIKPEQIFEKLESVLSTT